MRTLNIIFAILFLFPAFLSGSVSIILVSLETATFKLLRPSYKLPRDKAWIEVIPLSSKLWKFYTWYCRNYIDNATA